MKIKRTISYIIRRSRGKLFDKVRSKGLRNTVTKVAQLMIGKNFTNPDASKLLSPGKISPAIAELSDNGYYILDNKISEQSYHNIRSYLDTLLCHDVYRPELGYFKPEAAPAQSHIAHYPIGDLVKNKDIMDIANDPGVLEIVAGFLGAKPTISNIACWWSFKGRSKPEEAQNFHRDNDDIKFCKLFVYLTDVTAESGPHVYVKGTSASGKLRSIRRYTNEEVMQSFGKENVVELCYPQRSVFIVDTYGFHKGLLPFDRDRLLLQIQYSLYPIGYQDYHPVGVPFENGYDKYVNRLLLN
jgi:hypothetical protein